MYSKENRQELSKKIIEIALKMNSSGLNQGTSGNISVRMDDGLLITPSGRDYETMKPEDIVFINKEGVAEEGKLPSSEWRFHYDILKQRKELNAVIHNHSTYASIVSVLGVECIPAIHYLIASVGGDSIPCIPYATYGTQKLSDLIVQGMESRKACILNNHGAIIAHTSLESAYSLATDVEYIAKLFVYAKSIGQFTILPKEEINLLMEKFKTYGLNVKK
jgi:L-fuculose-phosphate aldolase